VEDLLDVRRILLVLEAGHEVHVARDGAAGIETAERIDPDVILCDLGLPLADGYQVVRRLRQRGEVRSSTIVALSGYASA
jgi:CheY-like chemotaxis protein